MTTEFEKTYDVRPQDFIPFIGSFIYQKRNWEKQEERPEPFDKYYRTGRRLTKLNFFTGLAITYATFQGLEALFK